MAMTRTIATSNSPCLNVRRNLLRQSDSDWRKIAHSPFHRVDNPPPRENELARCCLACIRTSGNDLIRCRRLVTEQEPGIEV